MVTIKDVAERAGVSKAAVSYALNGSNKVSEETREKILRIVEEMNYIPNRNAQILRVQKTMRIGVFLQFFSGSYYMYLIETIFRVLRRSGYDLEVQIAKASDLRQQISQIANANIDAAIVHYEFEDPADAEKLVKAVQERHLPIVYLTSDYTSDSVSSVVGDNEGFMEAIVDHLVETGHKKFFYFGNHTCYDERRRYAGYTAGLKKHGIIPTGELEYLGDDPCEWAGFQTIHAKFQHLKEIPDVICCANDPLAIGCINALQSFGYNVPNDISVTGIDNLIPAQLFESKLTTVKNPIEQMGKIAAEEALRLLNPGERGKLTVIGSELVRGETVAVRAVGR